MELSRFVIAPSLLLLAGAASAGTMSVPQDFATIQEAVTASVSGDVVVISPGWYRENVLITTSGITVKGKKVTIDGAFAGTCVTVQADDVTLTGLVFSNGGPAAANGTLGGGLEYIGSGANITKCEARGCADFGIKLTGTGSVVANEMSGILGPGLVLETIDPSGPLTTVRDNEIYRCASGIEADQGPFTFDRNIASNNTGDGIRVTLLSGGTDGSLSTPTTLTRNRSLGNGGTGLLVNDELGSVTKIEKCDISGNGIGLDLSSSAAALLVSDNDITQNRLGGVFLKTTGATVSKNSIGRNTLIGIVVASAGIAPDGGNTLTDNKIDANGGDGIHIATGDNLIHHNSVKDNTGDGLQVLAGAVANTLTDNMVRQNGNDGIDNWGTETLISDNTTKDNDGADLAGTGDGTGTVDAASGSNMVKDGTDLTSPQELELDTLSV
jgi:parallel beta-helix repeat protein